MKITAVKRIFCIEDEPEMIDLIKFIPGRRGYDVLGAAGGIQGIKIFREVRPEMDGGEVYQQLKADAGCAGYPGHRGHCQGAEDR